MQPPQISGSQDTLEDRDPTLTSLARLVRDALTHLYDAAYLQTHPLANLVRSTQSASGAVVSRAMVGIALRQSLLDAIESLRPERGTPTTSKAFRRFRILEMRYIEGLDAPEIQEQTAVSRSEYYREHHEALGAVTSLVQERWSLPSQSGHLSEPVPEPVSEPDAPTELDRGQLTRQEAEALRTQMQLELLDVGQVLGEVIDLLQPLASLSGVEIQPLPGVPIEPIQADRVVLRQALLGVFRQAIDRASPGQLHVRLDVRATSEGDGVRIVLTARPCTTERMTEDTTEGKAESGLDLALSRALVEGLRGTLDASRAEAGWTLTLGLPSQPFPRVLVVDNNADFIALVSRYLAREEWEVLGVSQPEQAVEVARKALPRVILLDVMMPGHDGWDLLVRLRHTPETEAIPVVICSVLDEPQLARSLGASGYLPKPLSQGALLEALTPLGTSKRGGA